jgi:predicted secreted protein
MNWVSGLAAYFVLWWLTLFAVLPLGTRPVADADASSGWRGAPEKPQILRKAIITTVVAAIVWVIGYALVNSALLDFRDGWLAMPKD